MKIKNNNAVTYHNKDVISKIFAENLKEKSFRVYGIDLPKIKEVLPTNLPAIAANELRIDNLFLLEDDSIAIIDYESADKPENCVKYLQYIVRVLERFQKEGITPVIRMIVIYTADVESAANLFSVGCLNLIMQQAFLVQLNSNQIMEKLSNKVYNNIPLTQEELMEFIILPLTYKEKALKQEAIVNVVKLAEKLTDKQEKSFVLSGILVFADKIIDSLTANKVKEMIRMTQVAELLIKEGREEGREEGILGSIQILNGIGWSKVQICQEIIKQYDLSEEEAIDYYEHFRE